MKRLFALIAALLCSYAVAKAAPQNYDATGNPVITLGASSFTTIVSSSGATPICPGGTASSPKTCTIVSITVGCVISVTSSCTGALVSGNIGGIFDAGSTSAAGAANEIFPLGALGSSGIQTALPWGPSGYRCQLGCVFQAGSALTNGVEIFVSGSNTAIAPASSATSAPALTLTPTNLSFITNGAAQSFAATQAGGSFSLYATPAPQCATIVQNGASFAVTPGTIACTATIGVQGIGNQQASEFVSVATPTPAPTPPSIALNPSTTSYSIVAGATAPPIGVSESNGNTNFKVTSSASSSFTGSIANALLTILAGATPTTGAQTLTVADNSNASTPTAPPVVLNVAVTAPVANAPTPYPIATANTAQSSQERTLLALAPAGLYAGREGSGTVMTDDSGNSLNGTYGSAITWDTALTTAPTAANHAPIYPSLTTTDATTNYATVAVSTILQPSLNVTLHARFQASANATSTYLITYGYQNGGPYVMTINGSDELQCIFRGYNSVGTIESISVVAPSSDLVTTGVPTDAMCGTNGTSAYLAINGQLVNSVTETTTTAILTSLNYTYSTTRGLTVGSEPGAAATYASPYSANFPGDLADVAVYGTYIAPPASPSDYTAPSCSLENAAIGAPAGSACSATTNTGSTGGTPGAISFENADGSIATSANLTLGTPGIYNIVQPNNVGGYTIAQQPDTTIVTAQINGSQLALTPVKAGGPTSIVIGGSGSVSYRINLQVGTTTAYRKARAARAVAIRARAGRQVSYRKVREEL